MEKFRTKLLIVFSLLLIIPATVTFAAGLVPCNGPDCTLCDFLTLSNNIITLLTQIGISLASLFFAWGALVIMTAGGSEEKVKSGKDMARTAVEGVVIALGAYIIIGTLLHVLTGSESAIPWSEIKCTF